MTMLNIILRNYKNLEGQNILGKIMNVQRLEDRVVLFKFYDETNMLVNYNYPPLQEFIDLKEFLREEILDSDLEENFKMNSNLQYPMKKRYAFLYLQEASLKLSKNTMLLEEVIYKKYLNDLILISYFNRIEKRFERMWKKPKNKIIFLKRARKYFFNRNINKFVDNFFVGNLYIRIFLKKFLSKIIFKVFNTLIEKSLSKKKNRYLPLILRRSWYSYRAKSARQLYYIPGLANAIIRTFKKRKFFKKPGRRMWFPKPVYFAANKKILSSKAGFFCLLQIKSLSENTIIARNYIAGKTWFSVRRTTQKLKRQVFRKKKIFDKNLNNVKGNRNFNKNV